MRQVKLRNQAGKLVELTEFEEQVPDGMKVTRFFGVQQGHTVMITGKPDPARAKYSFTRDLVPPACDGINGYFLSSEDGIFSVAVYVRLETDKEEK